MRYQGLKAQAQIARVKDEIQDSGQNYSQKLPSFKLPQLESQTEISEVKSHLRITNCDLKTQRKWNKSDTHGHDYIAVAIAFVGEGAHLAGGLFVLEFDADGAVGGGGEEIEHVAGVEADGDVVALVILVDGFLGFAVFRAGGGNFHAFI